MQGNPILAVLKIIVMTVLTVFLIQSFVQTQWLEEKIMKTREKVDSLDSNVATLGRKVEATARSADDARAASERTYERVNGLLDAIETGGLAVGPTNGGGEGPGTAKRRDPTTRRTPARRGTKTTCNGVTVYARNAGWTVICDTKADEDPPAEIPEDKVDWDATLWARIQGEPEGLNNYGKEGNVTVETLWYYAMDPLASLKKKDLTQYKTLLAERIEESPDRKQHMVYLRKGVLWHTPALDMSEYPWLDKQFFVSARDVKFTLDIIRDPDTGAPDKVQFEDIESVEIINEHQILVTWKGANYYSRAAVMNLQPMPEHIWNYDPDGKKYDWANATAAFNNHWFGKSICGNGPYRFVEYKPGQYIRYERFENYYGQRATCKEHYRQIIQDPEASLNKMLDKQLITHGFRAAQYRRYILEGVEGAKFRKWEEFDKPAPGSWDRTYFIYESPVYGGFSWNMRRPKLKDPRVRKAFTLCLNREAIAEKFQLGLASVIAIGESSHAPYFPHHIKPLPFDIEAAKALLEEAGWIDTDGDGIRENQVGEKRVPLEVNLVLSANSPLQKQMAQMYKQDMLEAGVRLTVDLVQSALWSQRRNDRDFDGFIIFWYAGWDSDPRQLWHSNKADEPNSSNMCGYADPEADKIFDALVVTWDADERMRLRHRWYEKQFAETPYTWFCAFKAAVAVDADWRIPSFRLAPRPYIDGRLIWKWKERP